MNTFALPQPEGTLDNSTFELIPKVLNILFKWKRLILICFGAVVVPALIVTLLKTPQYEVTMKILMKSSRAEVAISPAGPERFVNLPLTPAVVNSEIQILKSLELIKKAVEKSGYPLEDNGGPLTAGQKERALQSLQTRIIVTPLPDSNVIEVSFQDKDPQVAARFLKTLAALYLEKHTMVHRGSDKTSEFFGTQAQQAEIKYNQTSDALQKFQDKYHIIDIRDEIGKNLDRVSVLQGTLNTLQADIEGTEKEVMSLEKQVKQEPDQIPTQKTVMVNPEVTSMTLKIGELEKQRNELLQRYTPKSRFVIDKENEIAALRKQSEATQQHVSGDTIISQNKVKETLTQQIMQKKALLDSFKAKKRALVQEIVPYKARLDLLNDSTFASTRLRKQFEEARDIYFLYSKKSEESRISTAMDEEKMINVGIMQEAVPPVLPLGRGLALALAMAGTAGLALGVSIAFALEFFNLTIKSEDDIDRFLGVPCLATIRQF